MNKILLILFFLLFYQQSFSLPTDKKISANIISISSTKHTIMLNRGLSSAIVAGDHVKLIVDGTLIGRAIAVQVTPSRSIWSIYNFYKKELLIKNLSITIKMSTPVKLTSDKTKTYSYPEFILSDQKKHEESLINSKEVFELSKEMAPRCDSPGSTLLLNTGGVFSNKNWDIFGFVSFLSSNLKSETSSNSSLTFNIYGGIEKYLPTISKNISVHLSLMENYSKKADHVNIFEILAGVNWHFLNAPDFYNLPIFYVHTHIGMGNHSTTNSSSTNLSGSSNSIALGIGYKYYLANSFGFRIQLSYQVRNVTYPIQDSVNLNFSEGSIEPLFGLSYRY